MRNKPSKKTRDCSRIHLRSLMKPRQQNLQKKLRKKATKPTLKESSAKCKKHNKWMPILRKPS